MKKYAFNLGLSPTGLPRKILMIMKLIIVLMTTCLLHVSAAGFAQKLTYSKKRATLEQIFSEIRKQTGYFVVYAEDKVDKQAKLDVNFNNTDLKDVLDVISKSQDLTYSFNDKNIGLKPKEEPNFIDIVIARFQAIDVRGKVVDSLGVGIAGATVSVKGAKRSTSTAANGDFYLKNIEEGATLTISYIGYESREHKVTNDFNYIILKESTSVLDEVLVQAYGITTRRLSTGNVTMITSKEIAQQNINNPLLALQGRVAGVEVTTLNGLPGAPVNIKIRGEYTRGIGAISGNEPLIVIDGVPFANNIAGIGSVAGGRSDYSGGTISALSFINPNEIASISVLKDADATSIYGSRGSKGVILLTTKKGKAGQTYVDVTVNSGWQDVPKKLDLLNTEQYLEMRKEALKNGGIIGRLDNPDTYAGTYPDLLVWDQDKYTDWQKVLLGNTARYNDVQSTISGGNDAIQYRLGGTYHDEKYVFPGDLYDRKGSANMSVSGVSPNQKFKSSLSVAYMFNKNKSAPVDFTFSAMTLSPNSPNLYDSRGELNWEPNPYSVNGFPTWDNPLIQLKKPFSQNVNTLISNGNISYEFYPGLKILTNIGYTKLNGNSFKIESSAASVSPVSELSPFTRFATLIVRSVNTGHFLYK